MGEEGERKLFLFVIFFFGLNLYAGYCFSSLGNGNPLRTLTEKENPLRISTTSWTRRSGADLAGDPVRYSDIRKYTYIVYDQYWEDKKKKSGFWRHGLGVGGKKYLFIFIFLVVFFFKKIKIKKHLATWVSHVAKCRLAK
jgi:hypothetical protein